MARSYQAYGQETQYGYGQETQYADGYDQYAQYGANSDDYGQYTQDGGDEYGLRTICHAMLVFGWVASACVDMMRVWHACVRVMRACAYSLSDTLADLAM